MSATLVKGGLDEILHPTAQVLLGIDLHARSLYLCILDQAGKTLVHRKLACDRNELIQTLTRCVDCHSDAMPPFAAAHG